MRKTNRWVHGEGNFVLPPMPEDQKGQHGCLLCRATFDREVGEEVYTRFMEEPDFGAGYAQVSPFVLIAHGGLIPTPHGPVAFIVWQLAAGAPQETMVEQVINPENVEALRLRSDAANQTHLKLLIGNNETGEVRALMEFENTFGFEALALTVSIVAGSDLKANFNAAMQYVLDTKSTADLVHLSKAT
jgi:hypothetical protein